LFQTERDFDVDACLFKGRLSLPAFGSPCSSFGAGPRHSQGKAHRRLVSGLNARPAALLDDWLHRIKEELAAYDQAHPERPSAPFAVNQIVHKSNNRLEQDLAVCEKHKVPMVITSLGAREELNQAVHGWGGITFHDVINQKFAHKAIEKGADGLVLVAAGAGGHAGALSPFAFVAETRQWFDGPIALSGAIGHGSAIRAARVLGADFAYIGSAFIATQEANAQTPTTDDRVIDGGGHRLFESLHRRARQLPQAVDRRRRHGPGQSAGVRSLEDELCDGRQRRARQAEGNGRRSGAAPGIGSVSGSCRWPSWWRG